MNAEKRIPPLVQRVTTGSDPEIFARYLISPFRARYLTQQDRQFVKSVMLDINDLDGHELCRLKNLYCRVSGEELAAQKYRQR